VKKDQKYYGEVWFVERENVKQFAIISFKDDDLLLETNLCSQKRVYKEPQIFGMFTGLGFITFIDCRISFSSSGITETRVYRPKFSFISDQHQIDAINLKFREFSVINDSIVDWVNHCAWYDTIEQKLLVKEFKDEFEVAGKELIITLNQYQQFSTQRKELNIKNRGSISFELTTPIDFLEAVELYNQFQKGLQLLFGGSKKFERFSFKCLSCNQWQEVYYNDKKLSKSTHNYVHTEYEKVKSDLGTVLNAVYSNKKFQFCLDKLMENFISKQVSHNKRFTNSIATYEAFSKLYSGIAKNNLGKYIKHYKRIFILLGKFEDEEWKTFPNKVIRSRDYHIHSNLENRNVYTEFELLYISFLFDFVVGYLLLESLKVSNYLLEKFIMHSNNVFIDMKKTNRILGFNPFK